MTSTGIINNKGDNTLFANLIKNITPDTTSIDIEVGYFYLCGFELLSEHIKDIHVRILVGSYLDPDAIPEFLLNSSKDPETRLSVYEPRTMPSSLTARADALVEGIKKIANQSALFDSLDAQKSYRILEQKLENGSLEIKMTQNQSHGKYYVLKNSDGTGCVLMGSSNLTYNGLIGQEEINELLVTQEKFLEYSTLFDERWKDSKNIVIQEKDKSQILLNKIKNELWMNVLPTPYLMYVRLLHELFGKEQDTSNVITASKLSNGEYLDFSYQLDAIKMGLSRLEKYDGVIIADVVGLGKSIIASMIAANLPDLRTVIISPPHLMSMWEDYAESFRLPGARIFSSGKIAEAYEKYNDSDKPLLIILDEAHRYRNEQSNDYQMLHQISRSHIDNKVLALTATPFNNSPSDIFSLIKLFQTPGQSTLRTVENLSTQFMELEKQYKEIKKQNKGIGLTKQQKLELDSKSDKLSNELRILVDPVVIRRSRIDLERITRYREDLKKQNIQFSKMEDPVLHEYDLGNLTSLYVDTLGKLISDNDQNGFIGARYMPSAYILNMEEFTKKYVDLGEEIKVAQSNVASFMKRLLVMRFESSKMAFKSTLETIIKSHSNILEWIDKKQKVPIFKKGYIPSPDEIPEDEISTTESVIEEEDTELTNDSIKFGTKKAVLIDVSDLSTEYVTKIRSDLALLKGIESEWFGSASLVSIESDPKVEKLILDIQTSLNNEPERKIVIFSVFADTVDYVYGRLTQAGIRAFSYTSKSPTKHKEIIRENFDAGYQESKQKNDFDVLIATDAISEGYNLHRCGRIINFDIPYNPTRVIQRIGRINRINKKVFESLFIDNYFPTAVGEQEVHIQSIATLKMKIFNAVVGNESRTLTPDESPESFFKDELDRERNAIEVENWDSKHREEYDKIKAIPHILEEALAIPMRCRLIRENQPSNLGVGVGIKGENIVCVKSVSDEALYISMEELLALFRANSEEVAEKADEQFEPIFEKIKDKLFEKPALAKMSGNRVEAVQYVKLLMSEGASDTNYCDDLITVIRELDDINDGQLKAIVKLGQNSSKKIDELSPDEQLFKVEGIAPRHQIKVSLDKSQREVNAINAILFSQEHRV
ncbi:MAG: hypothetical protein IT410_01330 [Candidatus Doudnabacteria bacterium]|nr:hypothetical protein [Candidatus Doudnabacteria bacterium]